MPSPMLQSVALGLVVAFMSLVIVRLGMQLATMEQRLGRLGSIETLAGIIAESRTFASWFRAIVIYGIISVIAYHYGWTLVAYGLPITIVIGRIIQGTMLRMKLVKLWD